MTFNQINYFLAVANSLNFTRAAASLFVTQSTLSRSIAALETELGVTLLERDFHNVRLTPAGELMYKEMKSTMDTINGIIRRVQALADIVNDRFVIGILEGQSVEAGVLFAIRNLSDKYPQLSVDIRRLYHCNLVDDIKAGTLDVAQTIISSASDLDEELDYVPIKMLNNFLMAQTDDPVWNLEKPGLAAVADRVLIAPENFHPGLEVVNRSILAAGITPTVKKGPDMETQALWLEAGMGVYIGNEDNVIFTSRTFRPLKAQILEELPQLTEVLIWNKNHCSALLKLFLEYIRSQSPEAG